MAFEYAVKSRLLIILSVEEINNKIVCHVVQCKVECQLEFMCSKTDIFLCN